MGIIKEQIQSQIKEKFLSDLKNKDEKTFGQFLGNIGQDVTSLAKGIIGLGYEAVRHPIESAKTVGGIGLEVAKKVPAAAVGLGKQVAKTITSPIETTKEAVKSYQAIRAVPYGEQKKYWDDFTEKALQENEKSQRLTKVIGGTLVGTLGQELTHPAEYAYEHPFNFALDALTLGQATGANRIVNSAVRDAASKIPAAVKMKEAMREIFVPQAKLINAGYDDLAKDFSTTKSQMFSVQKKVIDETSDKFYKEFGLSQAEQKDFFSSIDALRRADELPTSVNPKIQKAINWWVNEEAPAVARAAGLGEGERIQNYLHHYFPEKSIKTEPLKTELPLTAAKRKYLEPSKDVGGFTDDPVLSISAIKSRIGMDNLRDGLIQRTVQNYGKSLDEYRAIMQSDGIDVAALESGGKLVDAIKLNFNVAEFRPKSGETYFLPRPIADELNTFISPAKKGVLDKLFLPFDVFNRNWKPLATAVRPRYHTRNIVGNLYNAIVVGGMNPKEIPIAFYNQIKNHISTSVKSNGLLGRVYKTILREVPDSDVMKLAIDNDVIGRGFFGAGLEDLTNAVNNGDDIMKAIKQASKGPEIATPIRPLSKLGALPEKLRNVDINLLGQWMTLSQKVGSFIEDNARLALFQEGLKRFGGDIPKAKELVNKHLFDYLTGLGEGDKIIKRFIPFWAWSRFNVPLQISSITGTPLRHLLTQKGSKPYVEAQEKGDVGFPFLSEQQKQSGYLKIGEFKKGDITFDKYIKTASVLPLADLARLTAIMRGEDDEIGFTPLKKIWDLILKDPTQLKDYFGKPIEAFKGEQEKFLGIPMRGRTKELLSVIPLLTELNKVIAGSYRKEEAPLKMVRVEQVLSPLGLAVVDREKNKFYYDLEKEKELKGSYVSGLESLFKKYYKKDLEYKGSEKYIKNNVELLEKELLKKGVSSLDILKIKNKAVKDTIKEAFK